MLRSYYNILLLVQRELFKKQRQSRGIVSHNPARNLLSSQNKAACLFTELKSMWLYSTFQVQIVNDLS